MTKTFDVLLVSMPFASPAQPSIGLSLLKAALSRIEVSSVIQYLNLAFAERIGADLYARITGAPPRLLLGEWLFARALFGNTFLDEQGYIDNILRGWLPARQALPEALIQEALAVRERIDGFLEECLDQVARRPPRIIGFTSIFQQHLASLALAKRIKTHLPETFIVFGGANCEGAMGAELLRQFDCVDAVVSGEGDLAFPQLVQSVLAGKPLRNLPGVYTPETAARIGAGEVYPNAPRVMDLDKLPYPDYGDYFEQRTKAQLADRQDSILLFETSRGCWWGERSQCTFCSLNGADLAFRSKSAWRVLDELTDLKNRYPHGLIAGVDRILSMEYFRDLLPELAARQLGLELAFDVKANLSREQVRLLREAGVVLVAPGIESLSNPVLKQMRKGVSALQNIQLLKWCKEYGLEVMWVMIWGFPGEPPEEYARMAQLIPRLAHLPPPQKAQAIRVDRFCPYFDQAGSFGIVDLKPVPAYAYIYPFAAEAIANLAYHFTYGYRPAQDVEGYTRPLADQVAAWQSAYEQSDLFSVDLGTLLLICDLRPDARQPLTMLAGLQRDLYLWCDRACTSRQLGRQVLQSGKGAASAQEIEQVLESLVEAGLMLRERQTYLSLAIAVGAYSPEVWALERLEKLLRQNDLIRRDDHD